MLSQMMTIALGMLTTVVLMHVHSSERLANRIGAWMLKRHLKVHAKLTSFRAEERSWLGTEQNNKGNVGG